MSNVGRSVGSTSAARIYAENIGGHMLRPRSLGAMPDGGGPAGTGRMWDCNASGLLWGPLGRLGRGLIRRRFRIAFTGPFRFIPGWLVGPGLVALLQGLKAVLVQLLFGHVRFPPVSSLSNAYRSSQLNSSTV